MYYPGQPIKIHPKVATLEQRGYYNTSGFPAQEEVYHDYDRVTYFNNEMRYLAGTTQYVVSWDPHTNILRVTRSGGSEWHWNLIPDWVLPTKTFKEL